MCDHSGQGRERMDAVDAGEFIKFINPEVK